jgi:hypothetical protein
MMDQYFHTRNICHTHPFTRIFDSRSGNKVTSNDTIGKIKVFVSFQAINQMYLNKT